MKNDGSEDRAAQGAARSNQRRDRARDAGSDGAARPVGVPIITEPHVHVRAEELAGRERDCLLLTAEERRWGRRRVRTRGGRELALALPTGSMLEPGEVLYVGADWYVVVEAATESVIAVAPRSQQEAIRVAFEVGNRHLAMAVDGERLLVLDDTAMEQLLTRLGVSWVRTRAIFVPVGAGHRHEH